MFSTYKLRNTVRKHCFVLNEVTVYSFSIRQSVEGTAQYAVYFYCCFRKTSKYRYTSKLTTIQGCGQVFATPGVYFDRNLSFFCAFLRKGIFVHY